MSTPSERAAAMKAKEIKANIDSHQWKVTKPYLMECQLCGHSWKPSDDVTKIERCPKDAIGTTTCERCDWTLPVELVPWQDEEVRKLITVLHVLHRHPTDYEEVTGIRVETAEEHYREVLSIPIMEVLI